MNKRVRVALKPPRDPGFGALRRATRAAIVIPLAFAFTDVLLRQPQSLIFVLFGCFSLLVMSDFGGARVPRAVAYLTTTVVGAVLVALGTLASSSTPAAVALMFVIGFVVTFSRVLGGYVASARTGLILSFVIAVTIPAPADAIPPRLGGWMVAGLVSTVAAVVLWPRLEGTSMHLHAGKALLAVADLIQGIGSGGSEAMLEDLRNRARQAVQAARHGFVDMAGRAIAGARRDRAFAELLIEIERVLEMVERPFNTNRPLVRSGIPETDEVVGAVVALLRSAADVLEGGRPPDLHAVEVARDRHRAALDRWAAEQLRAGRPADEVLDALDFEDTLRVVSYVVFLLGGNATVAASARLEVRDTAMQVVRAIRAHLESPSTVLQEGLRVAIGLALAVWVARAFDLSHAFWVVLGTIQVLRSNAVGTSRSVVLAVAGNAIGVLVGGLFAVIAGNHPTLMWIAFPIAVFGAAYAATMVGFMASQAAFTINLIVVFNLISPAGWQVGIVRIEDLIVGALISLGVGVLLWPAGARREFGHAFADLYRALVDYLGQAFDRILGLETPGDPERTRSAVLRARDRAVTAFDTFVTERHAGGLDREKAAFLLSAGSHVNLAADLLHVISTRMGYQAGSCADGARRVREQVGVLLAAYTRLAEELSRSPSTAGESTVSLSAVREAELGCLRRWQADEEVGRGAMAVVMAGGWLQNLAYLESDLEPAVNAASEEARKPWWR